MGRARFVTVGVGSYRSAKGEDHSLHVVMDQVGDISINSSLASYGHRQFHVGIFIIRCVNIDGNTRMCCLALSAEHI